MENKSYLALDTEGLLEAKEFIIRKVGDYPD